MFVVITIKGFLMDHAVMNLPFGGRDISKLINDHLVSENIILSNYSFDIQDIIDNIKVTTFNT